MGITTRQAATRIFSNASGSYSSNVNLAVENSSWSDEQQLQEMYLSRKSFAFNSDRYVYTSKSLCSQHICEALGGLLLLTVTGVLVSGKSFAFNSDRYDQYLTTLCLPTVMGAFSS